MEPHPFVEPKRKGLLAGAFLLLIIPLLAACGSTKTASPAPVPPPPRQSTSLPAPLPAPAPAPVKPQRPAALTKPTPVQAEAISVWQDVFLNAGWRIQRHFYQGTARLVDARGQIRAQGTEVACKQAFEYLRSYEERIVPRSPKLVLLLHGLGSNPATMDTLKAAIERDGFEVMTITYPTTEQGVQPNADGVERILKSLEGYSDVSIVAHSLGGLITRSTLSRPSFASLPVPVKNVVMLGTPNQGAALAGAFRTIARAAVTASANDLLPERAKQMGNIPVAVRFGVIAGGRGGRVGYNPLLLGDNDSVVRTEETKTANMDEWIVLPVFHTQMTTDAACLAAVRRFLKGGTLASAR
jgi:pimeloyl-ACP methyl ester carboxylesterase